MQRNEYITRIMQCIDEVHPDSQNDICSCYSVDRFLDDAAIEIIKLAPKYCIKNRFDFSESPIEDLGDGTGRIKVPNDYIKLTSFKMKGWHVSATNTITSEDKLYYKKTNRITGGGISRPIIVHDGDYLYYYALPLGITHEVEKAEAIVSTNALDNFSEMVADCVIWLTANKLLSVSGENEAATHAREQLQYKLAIL